MYGVLKNVYFQTTRKKFSTKIFFNVLSGKKRVLMHLRILPDHQNQVLKKDIFERLKWLKTCFYAFAHFSKPPETRYFLTPRGAKKVFWGIFAYFQTT
jgi:hypothetical protein